MRAYYLSVIQGHQTSWDAIIVSALLRMVSWIYTGIVCGLRWAYKKNFFHSYDLGRPVISVGNMTWGGVGKTPFVQWVTQELLSIKKNPVILTRGYMPDQRDQASDESLVLHEAFQGRVPVIANKDRVQGALSVPVGYTPDVFILDDGFQHWRVQRALNIVLIDAMNPFGNGAVLPRGMLREPLSALAHADIVVITRVNFGDDHDMARILDAVSRYCPDTPVIRSTHQPREIYDLRTGSVVDLSVLGSQPLVLVSGIGNPDGFQKTIESLGPQVREHCIFEDHHAYTLGDVEKILYQVERHQASCVVMTSKDAVKLKPFLDQFSTSVKILILNIEICITEGKEVLCHAIHSVCND